MDSMGHMRDPQDPQQYMEVSLNHCSQKGGNSYKAPYYNSNLHIGPRIDSNLRQAPHEHWGRLAGRSRTKRSQHTMLIT